MDATYTPATCAAMLAVHPNSVRLLCKEWGDFLSPGANPASGEARILTAADVSILRVIVDCRRQRLPRPAIVARLQNTPTEVYIDATMAVGDRTPPVQQSSVAVQSATAVDSGAALLALLRVQHEESIARIERVERRTGELLLLVAIVCVLSACAGGLLTLFILRVGV